MRSDRSRSTKPIVYENALRRPDRPSPDDDVQTGSQKIEVFRRPGRENPDKGGDKGMNESRPSFRAAERKVEG